MDATAISLCMDNKMPIVVFNMNVPGNLKRVVLGERVGSVVTAGAESTNGGGEFFDDHDCHQQGRAGASQDAHGKGRGGFSQGTGRACAQGARNMALLDHVRVDYHGTPMPINQLGTLNVPEPRSIVISPWDPGAVALIDKAIRTSDLGLNPTNDGKVVRVPIPPL